MRKSHRPAAGRAQQGDDHRRNVAARRGRDHHPAGDRARQGRRHGGAAHVPRSAGAPARHRAIGFELPPLKSAADAATALAAISAVVAGELTPRKRASCSSWWTLRTRARPDGFEQANRELERTAHSRPAIRATWSIRQSWPGNISCPRTAGSIGWKTEPPPGADRRAGESQNASHDRERRSKPERPPRHMGMEVDGR